MRLLIIFAILYISLFSAISVDAEDDYEKGLEFYRKHRYKEAIRYLSVYTQKTPDPRALYMIGYSFYKLRDFPSSRKYFNDTFLIAPDFRTSILQKK